MTDHHAFTYEKLDHPGITALLFHPRRDADGGGQQRIPVDDGIAVGIRRHLGDNDWPVILFFHGNGETVADYDEIGPQYNQQQLNFIVADYRGYGISDGKPSASTMMADCHRIYAAVREQLQDENFTGPLFIMGRSVGSACAIELMHAHQEEITGLIIDSGFASTLPLLGRLGVDTDRFDISEPEGFGNLEKIAAITKPVFMLHGQHDQIIPVGEAEKLQSLSGSKSKQFQMVPGADHNSIIAVTGKRYFEAIRQFINKVLGVRPRWSRRRR